MITIDAMSELGTRKNQQDSYLYCSYEDITFAVVCDGMGGMNGGDMASQRAVMKFKEDVISHNPIQNIPDFLEREVNVLDKQICSIKSNDGRIIRAGTTIVAVVIRDNRMFWLAVGDSEIFIIRENEIVAVNQKHNYQLQLDEMLIHGRIGQEVYEAERKRGYQLISFLGLGNVSLYDVNRKPFLLQTGDYICLCSDGLVSTIQKAELLQIVRETPRVEEAVKVMASKICKKEENQDNATAILMKYEM